MNATRRGKIARLPEAIRRQLNTRLRDGEPGKRLVAWLNSLPEVQSVLLAHFDRRSVTEQNLSDWRSGGYIVWLQQQEALDMATPVAEELEEMAEASGGPVTDQMATWLTVRYFMVAQKRETAGGDIESDWHRLREFCSDLSALRRGDHCAQRLKLQREQMGFSPRDESSQALLHCLELAKGHPDVMESFRSAFKLFRERRAQAVPNPG